MSDGADTPEKNDIGQAPVGLQHKTVQVAGINVAQRQAELEKIRAKMEAKGWALDSYHDEGWSKSKATFTRPMSAALAEKPNKLKPWHYVAIFAGLVFFGYLFTGDDTPKPPPEPTQVQLQAKRETAAKELLKTEVAQLDKSTVDVRREAVTLYAKANSIPQDQVDNFYFFLTEHIYQKDKFLPVSEVLDQAKKEWAANGGELKRRYYDLSGLKSQFTSDGAHYKLKKYVLEHMNDPASLEIIETRYGVEPAKNDKPPYLVLMMACRGKNAYGALVRNVFTAKADIYNGNVYDVGSVEE